MKIPTNKLIIPGAKLTLYLLVWRPKNDKSKFLAQAGFTLENPDDLETAIRQHVTEFEAIVDRVDEYGQHYWIEGTLVGSNGRILDVVTVWNQNTTEALFRFVTLKPRK